MYLFLSYLPMNPQRQFQRRLLQNYARRSKQVTGVLTVLCIVSFFSPFFVSRNEHVYIGIALIVGSATLINGIDTIMYRIFRCPECGDRLPKPKFVEGKKIMFICQRCMIEWDTGDKSYEMGGD